MSQNNQFQNMNAQNTNNKTPYTIEQIFQQICQFKVFVVNLKRAVLLGNQNFLDKVYLINSDWFQRWKKISCYEAIKDELSMTDDIPNNYSQKDIIVNYIKENNKITRLEVEKLLNIGNTRSKQIINKLLDDELIIKKGTGKNTYYVLK